MSACTRTSPSGTRASFTATASGNRRDRSESLRLGTSTYRRTGPLPSFPFESGTLASMRATSCPGFFSRATMVTSAWCLPAVPRISVRRAPRRPVSRSRAIFAFGSSRVPESLTRPESMPSTPRTGLPESAARAPTSRPCSSTLPSNRDSAIFCSPLCSEAFTSICTTPPATRTLPLVSVTSKAWSTRPSTCTVSSPRFTRTPPGGSFERIGTPAARSLARACPTSAVGSTSRDRCLSARR